MKEIVTFEEELDRHGTLIYTNVGVSMMPLLRQGRDLMVIRKRGEDRLKKYDAVLFKRKNGQYILHRILRVRESDYYIVGDNCASGEYVKDAQILGVLTEVVRDGKVVSMEDKNYRRYVHLWCDFFPIRVGLIRLRGVYYRCRHAAGSLLRKAGLRK